MLIKQLWCILRHGKHDWELVVLGNLKGKIDLQCKRCGAWTRASQGVFHPLRHDVDYYPERELMAQMQERVSALEAAARDLYNEVMAGAAIYSPELGGTIGEEYSLELEALRQVLEGKRQPDASNS